VRSSKIEIINGIVFDDGYVVTRGNSNWMVLGELYK
jgi:hypothetical protein